MSYCAEPDLREKLRSNGLLDTTHQASAIVFAQRWYDDRGKGPWSTGFEAKKRPPKAKGSVHSIELEDGQPDDLEVNFVKTTKCTSSCGKTGHDARSCLTSSKLVNIQPFKNEAANKGGQERGQELHFLW